MAKYIVSFTREVSYDVQVEHDGVASEILETAWDILMADTDKYEVFDEFSSYTRIEEVE